MGYYPEDGTGFCSVCGGLIDPNCEWLGEVVLLSCSGRSEDSPFVSASQAYILSGDTFRLHGESGNVRALDLETDFSRIDPHLLIPCHQSCVIIAEKTLSIYELKPLYKLWQTLKLRAQHERDKDSCSLWPHHILHPPGGWRGIWKIHIYPRQNWEDSISDKELDVSNHHLMI